MTAVYQAIDQRLWKKDILRLRKKHDGELVTEGHIESASRAKLEEFARNEILFLESLAFAGLQNDTIEFESRHLDQIFDRLVSEVEFPEQVLLDTLQGGSDVKITTIKSLATRPRIPLSIIDLTPSWLANSESTPWKSVVLGMLQRSRPDLPNKPVAAVIACLDDLHWRVRSAAVDVLKAQSSLAGETVAAVVACLDDPDLDIRQAAEIVLAKAILRHGKLYSTLLSGPFVASLYKILSQRSFKKQLSWYVEDRISYVNMPDRVTNARIDNMEEFIYMVNKARPPGILLMAVGSQQG